MILVGFPLFNHQNSEQSRHNEIYALEVNIHKRAHSCAEHTAHYPVDMVEQCDRKVKILFLHTARNLGGIEQSVGLVGKSKHKVELTDSGTLVLWNHRKPVEEVPEVYQEGEQYHLSEVCSGGEKLNREKLTRSGKYKYCHKKCPDRVVTRFAEHYPKCESKWNVSEKHRQRMF